MAVKPQFDGEWVKLGDCFPYIRNGYSVKQDKSTGGLPITRIETISGGRFNRDRVGYAGIESAEGIEDRILHDGDLLMSHINSMQYLGRTVMYREEPGDCFIHGMNLLRLKADRSRVDPCYAEVFFQSPAFTRQIGKIAKKSVNQASFSTAALKDLEFPILELDRQREIARLFQTISEKQDNLELQSSKFEHLVKSQFNEMFGDLAENPFAWDVHSFNDFAQIDTHMTKDFQTYADMPHIGIDSIESGSGRISGYRTIGEDNVKSGKYLFGPEHVIYSKIRPVLNKVALPSFKGLCSADAYPILPNSENCNRTFLAFALRSDYFLDYIVPLSSRARIPKTNKAALEGFSMPLPPLDLQVQFESVVSHVEKLQSIVQQQISTLQTLYDSLSQEYFS